MKGRSGCGDVHLDVIDIRNLWTRHLTCTTPTILWDTLPDNSLLNIESYTSIESTENKMFLMHVRICPNFEASKQFTSIVLYKACIQGIAALSGYRILCLLQRLQAQFFRAIRGCKTRTASFLDHAMPIGSFCGAHNQPLHGVRDPQLSD